MQIRQMAMQACFHHVFGQILVFKMQPDTASSSLTKIQGMVGRHISAFRQAWHSIWHTKIKKARHRFDHVYTSFFMAFKSDQQKIIIYHEDELNMAV